MEETIILCGEKRSINIPNNLPELMARKQKLLYQKTLAKSILAGNIAKDKRGKVSLEADSISSEIKAIDIEINKFRSRYSLKNMSKARKRNRERQKTFAFPTQKDWEGKYNWVRAQLSEAMDLLFSSDNMTPEELEVRKKI